MLRMRDHQIRGACPVCQVGDQMVVNGPRISSDGTDAICVHALSSLLHCAVAIEEGAPAVKLRLSESKGHAYMQCVDPGEAYTGVRP